MSGKSKRSPRTYKLTWPDDHDDPDLAGLVIRAKGLSMRKLLELMPLVDAVHADQADISGLDVLLRQFGDCLTEWNRTGEDDQPVDPGYDEFMEEDPAFIAAVLKAWTEAFAVVDPTSKPGSQPGETELSIPMETLTGSPGS